MVWLFRLDNQSCVTLETSERGNSVSSMRWRSFPSSPLGIQFLSNRKVAVVSSPEVDMTMRTFDGKVAGIQRSRSLSVGAESQESIRGGQGRMFTRRQQTQLALGKVEQLRETT